MFNFMDSKLTPKIVGNHPAVDNYEVENLVSSNYLERIRGFVAYTTVRPPVEIEIQFICPVNINYITLNTTVGSQKCSGIEIFAKTSNIPFTSICRSVYDKTGVVFCNSRKYSKTNLPPNFNSDFQLNFFKSNTFKCFLNANAIKVVIFRTTKSVPCLSAVEVWGTPSKACSAITVQTIYRIMEKQNLKKDDTASNTELQRTDEFKIPEDFKDSLTYEIMSVPMTLPSGKTVDQSTLDKHITGEISFGRKPCDPFTGIKFTEKIKPILNMALKSRIDMFLLQNSHREELRNVKRTLGKASTSSENIKKRKISFSSDLDEAISQAKESPGFTIFTGENEEMSLCSRCNKSLDNYSYEIPCQHKYCRRCILEIYKVFKCALCDAPFMNCDVKKCNL